MERNVSHSADQRRTERQRQPGLVVQYSNHGPERASKHESATRACIGTKLAALKGYRYAGEYESANSYAAPLYFVPSDTIVGIEAARRLGIVGEDDLFGGVVPYPFVATKTITHPFVSRNAFSPEGWSRDFGKRVRDSVLFGFSAFTRSDARAACARVLERGPARLKPARGVGGRGQKVITSLSDLEGAMEVMESADLSRYGIVIEENLDDVTTYSIGSVRVANLCIAYCGTQRLTPDHTGAGVYGGSDLLVARGDFEFLLAMDLAPAIRQAVIQARTYDSAAVEEFPQLIASRRNYDVAAGTDSRGRRVAGVLEQSWRIGGASLAEVAALEAFQADDSLRVVRASSTEIYDANHEPPARALVHFRDDDECVGPIIKYTLVEAYGHSQ